MPDPITLPSGSQFALQVAEFSEANDLKKAVMRELVNVRADLSTVDLDNITGEDLLKFKDMLFQILGSESIDAALWKCMARCQYNGQPATMQAFKPETARQDYQQAAGEVLIFNLLPFFAGLLSLLRVTVPRYITDRKSG